MIIEEIWKSWESYTISRYSVKPLQKSIDIPEEKISWRQFDVILIYKDCNEMHIFQYLF